MFKTRPANATVSFRVTHELPIQIRLVTIVKPPSPRQIIWATPRFPLVIVAVSGTKHHVAMVTQRVPRRAVVTADRHFVLCFFAVHFEAVVSGKHFFPVPVFELDSQRHLLGWSNAMNLVISKPEIPFEVAKAIFVVIPRAMEADRSVLSSLEHDPASTVSLQVAVYLKICFPVRVYRVHTTRSVASEKDINTSPRWIENKIKCKLNLPGSNIPSSPYCPLLLSKHN